MTPVLAAAVLAIVTVGALAVRRGVAAGDLMPPLALALVSALIAFNKVGSPQFITWLAVPILLGIVMRSAGRGGSFAVPATIGLAIAALTQLIYPYLYTTLLLADPLMVSVITVRNLLLFVLLGWAVRAIIVAPHDLDVSGQEAGEAAPTAWPFTHAAQDEPSDRPGVASAPEGSRPTESNRP
jgi:hypothetical protein